MTNSLTTLICASALALSACATPAENDQLAGALIGGAIGGLSAKALGGDRNWTIIGTLAGAAAGTLVARNAQTGDCAYARGDGTYYRARCR